MTIPVHFSVCLLALVKRVQGLTMHRMIPRFVLVGSLMMLNLVIAVVLDSFADQRMEEACSLVMGAGVRVLFALVK